MKRSMSPYLSAKENASDTSGAPESTSHPRNNTLNKASDYAIQKARTLKVIFLDVDGVLTDGRIWMMPGGDEAKCFDVKDGVGLKAIIRAGIIPVLISGRRSESVERRALELGIELVFQGIDDKTAIVRGVRQKLNIMMDETGSMGDDLPDLAMFRETALRFAPADAAHQVREAADFVTRNTGGRGAVREVCEWILSCRDFPEHGF